MKSLVQEASAKGGGGGSSNNGGSNGASLSDVDYDELEKLRKQAKDLKSLLLQRDSEINILVNMVKKNAQSGGSGGGGGNSGGGPVEDHSPSPLNNPTKANNNSSSSSKMKPGPPQSKEEGKMSRELQLKIIERHLFNVPPPSDATIFEDASKSFDYFRDKCSISQSILENKEILKEKINEAKTLGERASRCK
jgi:kinesin family protein 6/9